MDRGVWRWMMLAVACSVTMSGLVAAEPDQPPQTYAQGVTRKLGRGIANVVTAPLELIRTPYLVSQRDGGIGGISVGVVQGVWAMVVREVAGVTEVVSFLVPVPKDFQPLVTPEFVYAHGDWSP